MLSNIVAKGIKFFGGVGINLPEQNVFSGVKVFFSNHTSHLDFVVIWASIPDNMRGRVVPVGAKDYWEAGMLRRFFAKKIFKAALIDRKEITAKNNPLTALRNHMEKGFSLIIFPEGTRSQDGTICSFKSGIYHIAKIFPDIEFIPVYVKNSNRILPKGEFLLVPMLCSVTFGNPLKLNKDENKNSFLERAQNAIETLKGEDPSAN